MPRSLTFARNDDLISTQQHLRGNDIELVLPNHLTKLVVDIMINFKNVPLLAIYTKVRHNSLCAVARFYGCPAQLYNRYLKR
ncbi:DNA gyrase subunit A [Rickettsia parkeri str. Portsmouth]|nr:DNA gyrase subunit A [Rickettsia parkeri str. Portsmouth]